MSASLRKKIALIVNMDSKDVVKHTAFIEAKLNRLKSVAKTVFKAIALAATAVITGIGFLGKSIIETGATFEKFRIQLKVLYGSVAAGEKKFAWIKKFAADTPYELDEIVDAFIRLKATGLEGNENNLLRDLGDLAAATQKPLEQVVMAVSNIASGLTGIGMRQLQIMNISRKMMKDVGIEFSKSGEMISTPMQAIAALQKIIQRNFGGMMDEMSRTWSGIVSNINDKWTEIKAIFAEELFPVIKPDLERLKLFIDEIVASGKAKEWAKTIIGKLKEIYEKAKEWLPKIFEATKKVVNDVWEALKPIAKFLVENPKYVEGAAIVLIFAKVLGIAKEIVSTLKAIGITSLASGVGKALLGASAGTGASLGAGFAASAARQGMAGAAGGLIGGASIATIATVTSAVLAALGVGWLLYDIVANKDKYAIEKQMETQANTSSGIGSVGDIKAYGSVPTNPYSSYSNEKSVFDEFAPQQFANKVMGKKEQVSKEDMFSEQSGIIDTDLWERAIQHTKDMYKEFAETRKSIDDSTFEYSVSKLSAYTQDRLTMEKNLSEQSKAIMEDEQLGIADKAILIQQARYAAEEKLAVDSKKRTQDTLADIDELLGQQKYDSMTEEQQKIYDVEQTYTELRKALLDDEYTDREIIAQKLLKLEDWKEKEISKVATKNSNIRQKVWASGLSTMMNATNMWASGELKMRDALKVAAIQTTADIVAGELEKKAKLWALEAAAAAAKMQWGKAAALSAVAIAAGGTAAWVRSSAQAEIDRYTSEDTTSDLSTSVDDYDSSESGGVSSSSYSTRGTTYFYAYPTLTITGESVFVGEGSIETAGESLSNIIVRILKEAVETGEITLNGAY